MMQHNEQNTVGHRAAGRPTDRPAGAEGGVNAHGPLAVLRSSGTSRVPAAGSNKSGPGTLSGFSETTDNVGGVAMLGTRPVLFWMNSSLSLT